MSLADQPGRETRGANRYRVCAHQAQDAFHRLAGELLDVGGCQPDIHICLPQKSFRDGGRGGEALGDRARPIATRDAVASQDSRASIRPPNEAGKSCRYFSVLNCASA